MDHGPLVLEATGLPIEPPPLPQLGKLFMWSQNSVILSSRCTSLPVKKHTSLSMLPNISRSGISYQATFLISILYLDEFNILGAVFVAQWSSTCLWSRNSWGHGFNSRCVLTFFFFLPFLPKFVIISSVPSRRQISAFTRKRNPSRTAWGEISYISEW